MDSRTARNVGLILVLPYVKFGIVAVLQQLPIDVHPGRYRYGGSPLDRFRLALIAGRVMQKSVTRNRYRADLKLAVVCQAREADSPPRVAGVVNEELLDPIARCAGWTAHSVHKNDRKYPGCVDRS